MQLMISDLGLTKSIARLNCYESRQIRGGRTRETFYQYADAQTGSTIVQSINGFMDFYIYSFIPE